MKTNRMQSKVKIHDGIVGIIYLASVILAMTVNMQWLYLAGAVAVLQILSMFTGFCPVYFVLDRVMSDTDIDTDTNANTVREQGQNPQPPSTRDSSGKVDGSVVG